MASLLQQWTHECRGHVQKRQDELWSTIQAAALARSEDNPNQYPPVAIDDTAPFTSDQLVAIYTHLRYIIQRLAATPTVRVFAYRQWLLRLVSHKIIQAIPPALVKFFWLPNAVSAFHFTTKNLHHTLRQCGLPVQDPSILQDLESHWFDPVEGAFTPNNMKLMPCANRSDLEAWLQAPYFMELDNDVRPIAPVYHDPNQRQLSSNPNGNFSTNLTMDDYISSRPTIASHFMQLADALYDRKKLRYWAAQLYYRDPRVWCQLRRLVNAQEPHVWVLLQALLFLHPMFPTHMDHIQNTLELLSTNNTEKFANQAFVPTHVPPQVAVRSPPFANGAWINLNWKNADEFKIDKPQWKSSEDAKDNKFEVDLANHYHFQAVFDCTLAAFHFHLCCQGFNYDVFPLLLVRSQQVYEAFRELVEKQVNVYLVVRKDGRMRYETAGNGIWTRDAWFLIGLMKPNIDLTQHLQGFKYEEQWFGPAPLGPDKLRATRCSFFRRYIPDHHFEPLPGPGMGAPFTLLPMSGFR
jgi:hypothetical protein